MSEGHDQTLPPVAPAAQPEVNPFARIAGVLLTPVRTFAEIARRPDILVPLVLIVVIGFASSFAVVPRIDFDAMLDAQIEAAQQRNPNIKREDMEASSGLMKSFTKGIFYVMPFLFIIWYLIVAGVLLLGVRLFGGEGEFGQAFSVTLYSWIPYVILGIITTIVIVAKGSFDVTQAATIVPSNPAVFVNMKEQPVLHALLSMLDVFTFWTLALLVIGFAEVSKLSKAKTASIVVSLWVVLCVIRLGFTAMGAAAKG